nr:carbonic anhydrase 2-like isoform X1 [Ipomoea batatas]
MAGQFKKCLLICCSRKSSTVTTKMADETYEEAIAGLKKLLSDKTELEGVAAAKIKQLTAELEAEAAGKTADAVQTIRTGFAHFKGEKFE